VNFIAAISYLLGVLSYSGAGQCITQYDSGNYMTQVDASI